VISASSSRMRSRDETIALANPFKSFGVFCVGVGKEVIGLDDFFLESEVFSETVGECFTNMGGFFL